MHAPLLLAAGVLFSITPLAAGGGGGEEELWFEHDFEYVHLEMWMMIALAVVTGVFEILLNLLRSQIEKQYSATDLAGVCVETEEERKEIVEHEKKLREFAELRKPVWLTILNRGTGELTVLGFASFLIYVLERAGFFYDVAEGLHDYDSIRLPEEAVDYFHTTEDVHIQLFLTMLAFLLIVTIATFDLSRAQMQWNRQNGEVTTKFWKHRRRGADGAPVEDPEAQQLEGVGEDEKVTWIEESFKESRAILMDNLNLYVGHWEEFDKDLVEKLTYCYAQSEGGEVAASEKRPGAAEGGQAAPRRSVKEMMQSWFPFDEYVGLQSHFLVENILEITPWMWLYLIVLFIITSQVIRATEEDLLDELVLAITVVVLALVAFLVLWFIRAKVVAEQRGIQDIKDANHSWHGGLKVVNFIQLAVWTACYFSMRVVVRSHLWREELLYPLLHLIGLLLFIPIMGILLGKILRVLVLIIARGDLELQDYHLEWLTVLLFKQEVRAMRRRKRA